MNVQTTHPERLPQALADELDALLKALADDVDVCRALRIARESLRAISWARFKERQERGDRGRVLRRRHQGHGHARAAAPTEEREAGRDRAARAWSRAAWASTQGSLAHA